MPWTARTDGAVGDAAVPDPRTTDPLRASQERAAPVDATSLHELLTPAVRESLRPQSWRAAPPVEDRAAWAGIRAGDRAAVLEGARAFEERLARQGPGLSLWHHYAATGERTPYEQAQRSLLGAVGSSALALAVTGEERWAQSCADAVWRLCELSAWCLPSHYALPESGRRPPLPQPGRDILDLSDGYVGGMLAAVDTLAGDHLERRYPGLRARVHHEIRRRVLEPWRQETYFWHGLEEAPNNWAPWIVSNVLACTAVVEPDRALLASDVEQALEILDRFRAGYAPDGSCDEGATYWWWAGATLFEALEMLRGISGGALDGIAVTPIPAMSRFPMRMQIDAHRQVNYSDGSADLPPNANWHLLKRFGERADEPEVVRHARWMGRQHPFHVPEQVAAQFQRVLHELRDPDWAQEEAAAGMPRSWYAPGTELAVMREHEGAEDGWFLAVKGGHNDVSHNHNDVGGVIASLDGLPVLIDVGVETYRRETFEEGTRYTIWTMRSAYHSCPLPDGVEQEPGRDRAARGTTPIETSRRSGLRLDVAEAYPESAGLDSAWREAALDRDSRTITLHDSWRFTSARVMTLVLMTAVPPSEETDGVLLLGPARLRYDAARFTVQSERIAVEDEKLSAVWGDAVHRLLLTEREPSAEGESLIVLEPARTQPLAAVGG